MARFSGVSAGTVPANVNALVATTLPKVSKDIADNFFTATPFMWWMREKNRAATWDGGESLELPILFDDNPNARSYGAYEVMDVSPPEGVGTSIWNLGHYRVPIMYARSTAAANRGDAAVLNLVSILKQQAELSLEAAINTDLFAATTTDTNKVNSMYHVVQEAAKASQTTTPGGIVKSTYTWWRNQYLSATTSYGLLQAVREAYMECTNGSDTPDLGLCDDWSYVYLETKVSTATRFVNARAADFGFENITYKGMTIMFDKSIDDDSHDGAGDGSFFILNSKYLKLYLGSDANFRVVPTEYDRWQDAFVGSVLVDLQLTCNNMARQGVIQGTAWSGVD